MHDAIDRPSLSRREFLRTAVVLTAAAGGGCVLPRARTRTLTPVGPLLELSAGEAVAAMRRGDITAEAYATALLDQCAAWSGLNAFITFDRERVLAGARAADVRYAAGGRLGALHGLPLPVKDSINTCDYRTTGGTPGLADFHPARDAAVMQRLRAAGAFVLGKTNLHELSYGWTSNNEAFGPVRNPYDPERIAGGSSGGTAAAIAAGLAPVGLAEDTNGSIRIPAALCGIAGLRPSTGRWPQAGVIPITPWFDTVGPHARTVADLALLDGVVTGDTRLRVRSSLRDVRLGVSPEYFFAGLHPETARVTNDALARLRAAGATIITSDVPELGELSDQINFVLQPHDATSALRAFLQDEGTGVSYEQLVARMSPGIRHIIEQMPPPDASPNSLQEEFDAALAIHRPKLRANLRRYFRDHRVDAIVFPCALCPATRIGEDDATWWGDRQHGIWRVYSRNVAPGNSAGLPGLVLPAGLTVDGLPVGLEFDGLPGSDRALLGLGFALESALGPIPPPPVA